jgi:hypothetical protein
MKYERLRELIAKQGLSIKEMRERDQLINELLPLMMDVVGGAADEAPGYTATALSALEEA